MHIVATDDMLDEKFDAYEEACAWAQSMRRVWSVWKTGMARKHVVSARSADEALVVARGITHDYNPDTVQCR